MTSVPLGFLTGSSINSARRAAVNHNPRAVPIPGCPTGELVFMTTLPFFSKILISGGGARHRAE
jgi:hypothetical protein